MTYPAAKTALGSILLVAAFCTGPELTAFTRLIDRRPPFALDEDRSRRAMCGSVEKLTDATGGETVGLEQVRPIEGTIEHHDPVIQQALGVLGQAVNPIRVVGREQIREMYARVPGAGPPSAGLNAFRAPGNWTDTSIYVNRDSVVYAGAARAPASLAMLKLAATLLHEQVHGTDGELAAYRLQSDFVRSRLSLLPWRQRDAAERYLFALDARAAALARVRRENAGRTFSETGLVTRRQE